MGNASSILDAKLTYLYSRTGGSVVKLGLETTRALLTAVGVDPQRLGRVEIDMQKPALQPPAGGHRQPLCDALHER